MIGAGLDGEDGLVDDNLGVHKVIGVSAAMGGS